MVTRPLLTNIQLLRFMAAGGVLFSHAADMFLSRESALWVVPWTAGVDMFFVISGFVMAYLTQGRFGQSGQSRAFLIRRIIRIVPPYWLFTTLMAAAVLLFSGSIRNTSLNPAAVATSYLFIPWPRADGELNPLLSQGWTLNYEAFFYLAFAGAMLFRRGLAWLAGGFVLLAALHPWLPEELFILKYWSAPIILEFVAGAALAQLFVRGARLPMWAALGLIALAVVIFMTTIGIDAGPFNRLVHFGIPALLICASRPCRRNRSKSDPRGVRWSREGIFPTHSISRTPSPSKPRSSFGGHWGSDFPGWAWFSRSQSRFWLLHYSIVGSSGQ